MLSLNLKTLTSVLFISVTSLSLSGCGSDVTTKELENALSHEASFSFLNATNSSADFYLQKRLVTTGSSGLFDAKNVVVQDLPKMEQSEVQTYEFPVVTNIVNIGIKESLEQVLQEKTTHTLSDDDKIWVIAWNEQDSLKLTSLDKLTNDQDDLFNVRIFSDKEYDIKIANNRVAQTKDAKVTDYFSTSDCEQGLSVNNVAIDLCSHDLGASYLLVFTNDNKYMIAAEND